MALIGITIIVDDYDDYKEFFKGRIVGFSYCQKAED